METKKLICMYGCASSGKTTTAGLLKERLSNCIFIEEPVRLLTIDVARMSNDLKYAKEMQHVILNTHFTNLFYALQKYDNVISDRSLLDMINYCKLYLNDESFLDQFEIRARVLQEILHKQCDKAYIFKLNSIGFEDDGVRYSANYQREIDQFNNLKIDVIEIDTLGKEERITQIINILINEN